MGGNEKGAPDKNNELKKVQMLYLLQSLYSNI